VSKWGEKRKRTSRFVSNANDPVLQALSTVQVAQERLLLLLELLGERIRGQGHCGSETRPERDAEGSRGQQGVGGESFGDENEKEEGESE
jgi:hypothetical protein